MEIQFVASDIQAHLPIMRSFHVLLRTHKTQKNNSIQKSTVINLKDFLMNKKTPDTGIYRSRCTLK
jgi:hypothetical protein